MDLLLPLGLIVVGVAIVSLGVLRLLGSVRGMPAQGVVIGSSGRSSMLTPYKDASFRFTAVDGTEHSIWSPSGTGAGPEVGRSVQVRYDPDHPAGARISPPVTQHLGYFALGDLLLAAGIIILVT